MEVRRNPLKCIIHRVFFFGRAGERTKEQCFVVLVGGKLKDGSSRFLNMRGAGYKNFLNKILNTYISGGYL